MRSFKSILVANRGEIAVRVMRTAKALGYRTIAVYSEADAGAPHVLMADDVACIGPAPVGQSYLVIDKILEAARQTGAEAIHPGYGFLSENADFARACEAAGLVFIGPDAESIDLMGNKAQAKRRMINASVPCVPGYEEEDQSADVMIAAAGEIGFPLMVKAAAGGGGRGMRLVHKVEDMAEALRSAGSEALNAFGSDELILEKAIIQPRHVEIQVFADTHGNVIHLGERDCSVQRRHQKVVEEAPCPVMTPELRTAMGEAAVEAARTINYRGAGTVEFLLDGDGKFYFLEMNTRLQVEHPVTEMVTGLDLVALQIKVAEGNPLGLSQDDVRMDGHAMEVRLYAEDPANNFMPRTGQIALWQPAVAEGVRFDAGVQSGQEISPFYDPMIAKVIAWGEDRETARHRLVEALKDCLLFGSTTNRRFLIDVLQRETFALGKATTAFIDEEFSEDDLAEDFGGFREAAISAVIMYNLERHVAFDASEGVTPELLNWSSGGALLSRYILEVGEENIDLLVSPRGDNKYNVRSGDQFVDLEVLSLADNKARVWLEDRRQQVGYLMQEPGVLHASFEGRNLIFRNQIAFAASAAEQAGGGRVTAQMHGAVLEVFVATGDTVKRGDRLAVVEAMKMQHDILAEIDGIVQDVATSVGSQVAADDLLVEIEAA